MKSFEITTPALQSAMRKFEAATDGTLENDVARTHVAAGSGIVRAVAEELKVRLAMPKIAAAEAKLIEQQAAQPQPQIAQATA